MPPALNPETQRVANLRRRAAALERHARARGADGKSCLAVAAGRLGGQKTVERHGAASAWGLCMALKRWYAIPLPSEERGDG